jgi:NSS family neurotransmitter:Na+ symporter
MSTPPRERWGSRLGFTLAAVGSAVGLGNVWRFPYVVGEHGGAAFLLLYLGVLIVMGLPVMIAELAIGRRAQSDAVGAFEVLAPGKPWVVAGYLSVAAGVLILSYYAVIGGWVGRYLVGYLTGEMLTVPPEEFGAFFETFISRPVAPLAWAFGFLALTTVIVLSGVRRGIERANQVLMPLLAILLVAMAAYALTLPGAGDGLRFLLTPDWSAFARGEAYLAAVGQAFFSLSLGMGALLTYGSYLSRSARLPGEAARIVALDVAVAFVAGIVIFPAVFSFAIDPATGPTLVFVVLPGIFEVMPGGALVGLAFFVLLAAAALSSGVSLLEVVVAYAMRRLRWSRRTAALTTATAIFALSALPSLGYGALSSVRLFERSILDGMDLAAAQVMLPLGGLIFALFVGWSWGPRVAMEETGFRLGWLGRTWLFTLRWLTPPLIVVVLARSLGLV